LNEEVEEGRKEGRKVVVWKKGEVKIIYILV